MGKYFIHCDTNWCGEQETYRVIADSEDQIYDLAEQLAYDNFREGDHMEEIMADLGYYYEDDPEAYEEAWNCVDKAQYYDFAIEEADEDEWDEYDNVIYNLSNETN